MLSPFGKQWSNSRPLLSFVKQYLPCQSHFRFTTSAKRVNTFGRNSLGATYGFPLQYSRRTSHNVSRCRRHYSTATGNDDSPVPEKEQNEEEIKRNAVISVAQLCSGMDSAPCGPVQKYVWNNAGLLFCHLLAPHFTRSLKKDFCKGAEISLKYTSESVQQLDGNALLNCCESCLYDDIAGGLQAAKDLGQKLTFHINDIRSSEMGSFIVIIGAQRGEHFKGRAISRALGQHFIINSDETKEATRKGMSKNELVREWIDRGCIVMCNAIIGVQQTLYVEDSSGNLMYGSRSPCEATQVLRLEASVFSRNPELTFSPTNDPSGQNFGDRDPEYDASDWLLVDMNDRLNGNYPIKPDM